MMWLPCKVVKTGVFSSFYFYGRGTRDVHTKVVANVQSIIGLTNEKGSLLAFFRLYLHFRNVLVRVMWENCCTFAEGIESEERRVKNTFLGVQKFRSCRSSDNRAFWTIRSRSNYNSSPKLGEVAFRPEECV